MNFEIPNSQPSAEAEDEHVEKKEREAGPQTCAELLLIFKEKSKLPEFEQNFTDTDAEQNLSHTESEKESADSTLPESEQNSTGLAAEQGPALAETDKESADTPISKKLRFEGIEGWDVYNVAPFLPKQADGDKGLVVVIGRTERCRDDCKNPKLRFFEYRNTDGIWAPIEGTPVLPLEDGFATLITTKIGREIIVGGVMAYPNSTESDRGRIDYHMVFYRDHGEGLAKLEKFAQGPPLMKDIRFVELPKNPKSPESRIAAITRPTGGDNGKGKMAYIELNGLDEINPEKLAQAKVIENQFAPGEWGGPNQLYPLSDGRIGVLAHIACIDKPLPGEKKGRRHYYAASCIYNPKNHETTPMEIIATRKNFPKGEAKSTDLQDVVFAGGMVRHGNGKATLYARPRGSIRTPIFSICFPLKALCGAVFVFSFLRGILSTLLPAFCSLNIS